MGDKTVENSTLRSQLTPPSSIPAPRHIDASLEQRLSGMETSLKRLDNIESALTKLTSRLGASTTKTPSTYTATKSNGDVYGCHEISEIFSQVGREDKIVLRICFWECRG
ncbi:hypothetical protein NECAME_11656 [Necator americanus]|uniref:Uncharacterized protein n=1 Tax=Necator americanus TaxID=51031 RepID=W2T5I6_NECAM|nr:hypothetical protein NECAME_11656 [Necator americanus]ETN76456.1 hypothetical protein NECAME_11656 [Necator americanus]